MCAAGTFRVGTARAQAPTQVVYVGRPAAVWRRTPKRARRPASERGRENTRQRLGRAQRAAHPRLRRGAPEPAGANDVGGAHTRRVARAVEATQGGANAPTAPTAPQLAGLAACSAARSWPQAPWYRCRRCAEHAALSAGVSAPLLGRSAQQAVVAGDSSSVKRVAAATLTNRTEPTTTPAAAIKIIATRAAP